MNEQVFLLPDGRKLGYTIIGKGQPVVYFHGTASSRLEVLLLERLAYFADLQIIGIDRPGYGLSSFKHRKNLQDFNKDVNCLTQNLGIERFAVLGWSGGGIFTLAYLSHFPEHVTKAIVVSAPMLPFDVSTAHNMPFARFIMRLPFVGFLAIRQLRYQLLKVNGEISSFLESKQGKQLLHSCSKRDLAFFSDISWMRLMYQSMIEAFRQGNQGVKAVVEEHQLFLKSWDCSFDKIASGKLFIWHGTDDKTCRVSNAYAISKIIPNANVEIFQDAGHCVMFENLERVGKILSSVTF